MELSQYIDLSGIYGGVSLAAGLISLLVGPETKGVARLPDCIQVWLSRLFIYPQGWGQTQFVLILLLQEGEDWVGGEVSKRQNNSPSRIL